MKKLLTFLVLVIALTSCQDNTDSLRTANTSYEDAFVGEWRMIQGHYTYVEGYETPAFNLNNCSLSGSIVLNSDRTLVWKPFKESNDGNCEIDTFDGNPINGLLREFVQNPWVRDSSCELEIYSESGTWAIKVLDENKISIKVKLDENNHNDIFADQLTYIYVKGD